MCGRYATTRTSAALNDDFGSDLTDAADSIGADYNMAPTKRAPLIIGRKAVDADVVRRELITASWGLVPAWAKDPAIGHRMINARAETVHEKPSFRRAFATRRALVPVDGYYEWYQPRDVGDAKPRKQPFYLTDADQAGLALAGLFEFWRAAEDAPWLISFTIMTTSAEGEDGRLHDRAPLLLRPESYEPWLEPVARPREELARLTTPATPGRLVAWPVSTAVNNVRNNGPDLIRPLPAS